MNANKIKIVLPFIGLYVSMVKGYRQLSLDFYYKRERNVGLDVITSERYLDIGCVRGIRSTVRLKRLITITKQNVENFSF